MARSEPLLQPADSILGNAPSIRALRDQIQQLASFDTIGNLQVPTLLLHGETGTGKGLLARVTHQSGPRANGPFIEINCAAIAENILEAELFGFEAGAFTDAKRAKPGLFEAASRGTLFLDDVDTLPMPIQAKFLKVIEEKCVRRLGSVNDQQVDVKVIAATQKDLHVHVNEGRFRDDLYHRLAVLILKIPALRDRSEDIVLLAGHFLRACAKAHGLVPKRLGQTAEEWLLGYRWPGNVRELSHLMVRATLVIPESVLDADLLERLSAGEPLPSTNPGSKPLDNESKPSDESARISDALARTGGNVVRAAQLLGLGRNALRYRMRRYGIEPPSWRNDQPTMSLESEAQKTEPLSKSSGQGPDGGHQKAQLPQRGEDPATMLQENATAKLARVLRGKSESAGSWRKTTMAIAAVLLVVMMALLGWNFYRQPLVTNVAPPEKDTALSVSDKPFIAVLPFSNLSGDPRQEYLSDGISDNIITRLATVPEMLVVARNSSITYKDKPVKVQEVGRELGVRYLLEGAVQKAGERIRVSAQLIDSATGEHLWADSYDRELNDLFAIQDDITLKIVNSLQVKLTYGEISVVTKNATENVEAWEASVQGWSHHRRRTKNDNIKARQLWQKALELDPEFALAYALIGSTHMMDSLRSWVDDPQRSLNKAEELAHKALSMDDSIARAHALLGNVYMNRKQYEKALAEMERGVALEPNNPHLLGGYAHQLMLLGRAEKSVTMMEKSLSLHPTNHVSLLRLAARVYYFAGRYDKAIAACEQHLALDPKRVSPRVLLIASLVAEEREDEARAQAEILIEQRPNYSIMKTQSRTGFYHSFKDPEHWERLVSRLKQAGLPE